MSNRAIDRFRPQSVSKSRPPSPELPTPDTADVVADYPLESVSPASATALPADVPAIQVESRDRPVDSMAAPSPSAASPVATSAIDPVAEISDPAALPSQAPRSRVKFMVRARRQLFKGAKVIGVPLIWIGVAAFCGGTGYAAFNWLSTIPPIPDCDRLWFFSGDSDKLFCAEQAARTGSIESLQAGMRMVEAWPPDHQLHAKATRLYQDWSKQLLQAANQKAMDDDLDGAIQLASTIKAGNPVYEKAKKSILAWQQWRDRQALLASTVEAALKAQDWKKAEAELQPPDSAISDTQRQQINLLRERLVTERIAFTQLQQVRELVKSQSPVTPNTLGQAIQLVSQINPNSYMGEAARQERQNWSEQLQDMAEAQLQQGNIAGAMAIAGWIPADIAVPQPIQDLLTVGRAQQPLGTLFKESDVVNALWQQSATLTALGQIRPESPLYPLAQTQRSRLEQPVQDLTQLSLAIGVAATAKIPALQTAISMAQGITVDRPHRLAAQTLIAHWRREIERIQDRPYLVRARKLAAPGKVKDLQAAIAEAKKIALNRALRADAQAAIFDWNQKIQTIEDQPTLDQARKLAQNKQLPAAIDVAHKIAPRRALYPAAQTLIQTWTATIQTTEDQPILDEAKTLAAQGNFRSAIDVAYQIAPGRALYNDAQTAIAQWTSQLPPTRRSRWAREDRHDPVDSSRDGGGTTHGTR